MAGPALYPKASRAINVENPQTAPKVASTPMAVGIFLEYDGAGAVQPLTPTSEVVGLNLCPIAATDPDYASNKLITYDGINQSEDRFQMPVTTGTALASMIGSPFDIDAAVSYGLDVSAPGTQFVITKVISTILVEVQVVLVA